MDHLLLLLFLTALCLLTFYMTGARSYGNVNSRPVLSDLVAAQRGRRNSEADFEQSIRPIPLFISDTVDLTCLFSVMALYDNFTFT